MGKNFIFVISTDGQQHVLTDLPKAPPCGFRSYQLRQVGVFKPPSIPYHYAYGSIKETYCELGDGKCIISPTTHCDLSVTGGNFYNASARILVE